ncbi:MAG: TetR/AcrR family transcriptional regulator [Burkholderiaceae bacterium]
MPAKPAPAPTRLPTEERQALIVAAAITLAGRNSPDAITTGNIARQVGVTQGALFKHFPSREAIWLAVMEWVTQHLLARLEDAARAPTENGSASPALDALARVFAAHIDFVRECPGVPRLIFHDLQQPVDSPLKRQLGILLQRYRQLLTKLLHTAVTTSEAPAELDVPAATTMFIGIVQGLAMQSILNGPGSDLRAEATRVFPLYLRAIGKTP